jgi:transcriptional regulator with XRE-family HTH domain
MLSASLRRARERSGISRELLSALSEVPTSRIEAWETGESEPTPTDADSAARAFGVRLRDLEGQGGWPLEGLLFRAHDKAGS